MEQKEIHELDDHAGGKSGGQSKQEENDSKLEFWIFAAVIAIAAALAIFL